MHVVAVQVILVLLDVQEAARDLLNQHGPIPLKGGGAVAKPPLDVAGRVRASVEGVQRRLRRNGEGRRANMQASVCCVEGFLHCGQHVIVESACRLLDVQDELLHAMPATLVDNRLERPGPILNLRTLLILDDLRSVSCDGFDICIQGLQELDRLDTVHRVHRDAVLGDVASVHRLSSAVALGGRLKSIDASLVTVGGSMVRGAVRIVSLFLHSADVRCSGGWPHQSGRRVLRAINFLCAREDMLRYAVCILAYDDVAKAGTALLSLADDAHILLAVYKCPLRLGEVVDMLRVKMTVKESTKASGGGGSSKDGTSAVGCAKRMALPASAVS